MNRFSGVFVLVAGPLLALPAAGQPPTRASLPVLHHVGLNSVDPDRAIEWYLKVWPTAKRTDGRGLSGHRGRHARGVQQGRPAAAGRMA